MFTLKLETERRAHIDKQRKGREHDAWFRAEMQRGLDDQNDPNVELVPDEDINEERTRRRQILLARVAEQGG